MNINSYYYYLRGKNVSITGGNVVNNIRVITPELFPSEVILLILSIESETDFHLSLTSPDSVDTDYRFIEGGVIVNFESVIYTNIKIKSTNNQNIYIYTAGNKK